VEWGEDISRQILKQQNSRRKEGPCDHEKPEEAALRYENKKYEMMFLKQPATANSGKFKMNEETRQVGKEVVLNDSTNLRNMSS